MLKKMPASVEYGPSVILHEITASGIDQYWDETIYNSNRLRVRTADYQGNGQFSYECNFPFTYSGVTYTTCTDIDEPIPWCSLETSGGYHVAGEYVHVNQRIIRKCLFAIVCQVNGDIACQKQRSWHKTHFSVA